MTPSENPATDAVRFQLLVEAVLDYGIFMLNPDGTVASWNSGAQQIKGYRPDEIMGRHFSVFYLPEAVNRGWPEEELRQARRLGRFEDEGWRVRKDGSRFWANVVITALFGQDGELTGFAKVTRDMTERRRLEDLENSSKRMNEFLAMLAHELRNPLAPMRNAVTLLQLEPSPSPVVRNSRDIIDRQLSHMTRLVDDLLDAGRMSTGKIALRKEQVDWASVVGRAVEGVRPLLEARRHQLTVSLPPVGIQVDGDPMRLMQVLQNLLTNAAKYTPEGGSIKLAARMEDDRLMTEVRDNGIGLAPDSTEDIFQLFKQGHGQTTSKDSGLGIGLTLARSLVELHGGTLDAESPGVGMGSTFRFFLPNARSDSIRSDDEAAPWRCLIIDDNKDAADSLADVLRLMGWSVKLAYDGAPGVAIAREWAPHAVLLDLGMPGMSGLQAVRLLRALPGGPQMTITAVTGYGMQEDRERTRASGFDAHLVKPVDFAALQRLMEAVQKRADTAGQLTA